MWLRVSALLSINKKTKNLLKAFCVLCGVVDFQDVVVNFGNLQNDLLKRVVETEKEQSFAFSASYPSSQHFKFISC
jgi:hypothetical protein